MVVGGGGGEGGGGISVSKTGESPCPPKEVNGLKKDSVGDSAPSSKRSERKTNKRREMMMHFLIEVK